MCIDIKYLNCRDGRPSEMRCAVVNELHRAGKKAQEAQKWMVHELRELKRTEWLGTGLRLIKG